MRRIEDRENHIFTQPYAQPDDYHFCWDSVILPRVVAEEMDRSQLGENHRTLDLCAGCGVIGLELAHLVPELQTIDFLEVQDVFHDSFLQNVRTAGRDPDQFRFLLQNFTALSEPERHASYDLIVCNPPYFLPTEGCLPPSVVKQRCRFFMDGTQEQLLRGLANALKSTGEAWVLMKSGRHHGRDLSDELESQVSGLLQFEPIADIRGTWVLRFRHPQYPGSPPVPRKNP